MKIIGFEYVDSAYDKFDSDVSSEFTEYILYHSLLKQLMGNKRYLHGIIYEHSL